MKQRHIKPGFEEISNRLRRGRGQIYRGKMSSRVITPKGRKLREKIRECESRQWRNELENDRESHEASAY